MGNSDGKYLNAGTDATVIVPSGDKASMGPVEIADPDDNNDFEKGDVNHGLIETADLGMIQTGTIQHDGWGASPDWMLDSVKITNDDDGRVWLAGVNAELKGGQPKRLVFSLVDRGQYDIRLRQAKIDADKKRKDAEIADRQAEQERLEQEADQAATEGAAEPARQKAELPPCSNARAKNQGGRAGQAADSDQPSRGAAPLEQHGLSRRNAPHLRIVRGAGRSIRTTPIGGPVCIWPSLRDSWESGHGHRSGQRRKRSGRGSGRRLAGWGRSPADLGLRQ
ncbi:MAG: hypothetical protein IPN05_09435 [Sulfuritalea sp.]|nr:hypothetical protein [Sulfuritalea sp.]